MRKKLAFLLLFLLCFGIVSPFLMLQIPQVKATTETFGYTTIGEHGWAMAGVLLGSLYSLSEDGTVSSITVYVGGSASDVKVGIYSDVAGVPTALICVSALTSCTVGWNTISITPQFLSAGSYWLCMYSDSAGFQDFWDGGGGTQMAQKTGNDFRATFNPEGYNGQQVSIYATYTPAEGATVVLPTTPYSVSLLSNGTYCYYNGASYTMDNLFATNLTNQAITDVHALSGGGTVTLNATGGYLVQNATIVPKSNVYINVAAGTTISHLTPVSLSDSFSILWTNQAVNNFTVNGGVWDGNRTTLQDHRGTGTWNSNFGNYFGFGFFFTGSTGITYENLVLQNVIGQGLEIGDSYNSLIKNCTVINAGDNPITLEGNSGNNYNGTVTNCTVTFGQDVGINTFHADNCTLSNNIVSQIGNYTGASHWGVAIENSLNDIVLGNTISNVGEGLVDTGTNSVFDSNIVTVDVGNGIHLENSINAYVHNNTVSANGGVALGTYTSIQTLNPRIINNTFTGFIDLSASNAVFTYNILSKDSFGYGGITDTVAPTSNIYIAYNTFTGFTSGYQPITLATSTNTTIQANTGLDSSVWKTLNVTVSGSGSVSEASGTNQSLSIISGNNWQFQTNQNITLTPYPDTGNHYDNATFTNGTSTTANPIAFPINVNKDVTVYLVLTNTTQYSITVSSTYGNPTSSGLVNSGDNYATSVTSPYSVGAGIREVCTGYSIDGGGNVAGTSYTFTNVLTNHTITYNWQTQYYLTVTSTHGSPQGAGWYAVGATAPFNVTTPYSGGIGIQYVFTSWTGSGAGSYSGPLSSTSIVMNDAVTETASWTTQYYLTPSNDSNCAITPANATWVNSGASQTFNYSASLGFNVTALFIDGVAHTPIGTSYTFTNVLAPHTIAVFSSVALPPVYSSVTASSTTANVSSTISVTVNDAVGLQANGQYQFGTNNTGSWVWVAIANFTTTPQTLSNTIMLNSTVGTIVACQFNCTNNALLSSNTGIQILTTEAPVVTPTPSPTSQIAGHVSFIAGMSYSSFTLIALVPIITAAGLIIVTLRKKPDEEGDMTRDPTEIAVAIVLIIAVDVIIVVATLIVSGFQNTSAAQIISLLQHLVI